MSGIDPNADGRMFQEADSDPTANVLANIASATRRLDDLRVMESTHHREMADYREAAAREREDFNRELRKAESSRIDAIRAVDVGAVSRAAEVSATQAATLAAQVATSAETLRGQVGAAAIAAAAALATALEPIQKSIDDLRRAQYEQQGQKYAQTETRGSTQWGIGFALSAGLAVLTLVSFVVYILSRGGV